MKEVDNLIRNHGEKYFFISEWYKHKDHKQIFWNIVYYFNVFHLPTLVLTFISDELLIREILNEMNNHRTKSDYTNKESNKTVSVYSNVSNLLMRMDSTKSTYSYINKVCLILVAM